ncbi:thioredoxin-disulfide reductase [Candidatus Falkowbacteria bacterium RIFOXYB2_FULL_38_15]|uniref:Thioredoxin reductase n=1 Tax=Candidatus Falkowbacteria bacterium RIFOXYA2_FULL_38_12 TaxID=1797993 RepID=A0A1F5S1U5_9BACT|nr:MAG: thioredoxin-disulfide reductase [Candidatus Falkowbacteria bacterium RIFOXYA2_FULL_38_12]OGF33197.1 MAG: thioredoxin-disulfide reductase [Candidatus Falkowbacteria bacterium RIFOXYB2_FULL_38_15]
MFDIIIIGGGPAGLSAAIYASRRALKVLIISKDIGGQAVYASKVENYPGLDFISGFELAEKMRKQAEIFGTEFLSAEIGEIKKEGDIFKVEDKEEKEYQARAIILCFGAEPKKLNIPGETKFKGRGVSYCATCDAPFYKNKIAVVVGGGNSAVDAAVLLAKYAKKVYIVNHKNKFKAEELRTRQLKEFAHLEIILDSDLKEITGEEKVSGVTIKNLVNEEEKEIEADGVFIEIGHIVESDFISSLVKLDERKQIIVDSKNQTNFPGVFAAGDATTVPYKQIVIAAGEGAKAALSAYGYLQKKSIGE